MRTFHAPLPGFALWNGRLWCQRLARGNTWVARWLRFGRRGIRWQQDPERVARRAVFRLASKAMPTQMREVLWLLRGLRGLGVRQR
jgi:hypothetical protein